MQNSMVRMWNCFILMVFSTFSVIATAPVDYTLLKKEAVRASYLATDYLKNSYIVSSQNQVSKYDSLGQMTGQFSEKKYGAISSIDATSPFNVLLFYKDFSTVVTVDNQMNIKNLYRLSNLGISRVSAACLSFDNYIWVFDVSESKLKKINSQYEVIQESLDLRQIFGTSIQPSFLVERNDLVYMSIPQMGIVVFDLYGNYYNSIPNLLNLNSFQVIKDKIVFFQKGELHIYHFKESFDQVVQIPAASSPLKDVKLEKNRLYILHKEGFEIYRN